MVGPREALNSKTAPTRPLSEFEKSAFAKSLKTGKPEVLERPTLIKMVAPILAEGSCSRCHDVDTGEPLGAFSYELEYGASTLKEFKKKYAPKLVRLKPDGVE